MDDGRRRAALAVAARRGELEWTQQQLADEAHVDVKTIGNLESRGRWPNARNRARIERALGWTLGRLAQIALSPEPVRDPITAKLRAEIVAELGPEAAEGVIAYLEEFALREEC